jgi:hypothetical protein
MAPEALNVVVFLGPSLDRDAARRELDATFLPPASQGDVYLAARARPWGIGIVDGYFSRVPAVWHKEILWALSRGVHVFGAASMGALRAAELATFGMRGAGRIFDDYAAGRLEDDDEVAILHADAAAGYRALSDALVNIRATLTAAVDQHVIDPELHDVLLGLAKSTFYQDRSYARLLRDARARGVATDALQRFERWLSGGAVDQKRQDALAMLRDMRAALTSHPDAFAPSFRFQHTDAWEQVRRQIHLKPLPDASTTASVQGDAVIAELRLRGDEFLAAQEAAFQRVLSRELSATSGERVDPALVSDALNDFCLRHGLHDMGSVEPWLAAQGLDLVAFSNLLREELAAGRQRALFDGEIERELVQQLRLSGRFRALQDRAAHKHAVLEAVGLNDAEPATAGIAEDALWVWFFEDHLGLDAVPEPDAFARRLGCPMLALRREVLREWAYRKHGSGSR